MLTALPTLLRGALERAEIKQEHRGLADLRLGSASGERGNFFYMM